MRPSRAVGAAVLLAACGRPSPRPVAGTALARLDSATIDSVCVSPDSVRAGRKSCVLRDQRPAVAPGPRPGPALSGTPSC